MYSIKYYPAECTPSVLPFEPFNPADDAKILHAALNGKMDPDENTIINILGNRNFEQRLKIGVAYNADNCNALMTDLQLKLNGHFKHAIMALMMETGEFYAIELHKTIWQSQIGESSSIDGKLLIEILSTFSNHGIQRIFQKYMEIFDHPLISDIKLQSNLHSFIMLFVQADRDETLQVEQSRASTDIDMVYDIFSDDDIGRRLRRLNKIFKKQSYIQLQRIFQLFEKITETDFESLFSECDDLTKAIYLIFTKCCKSKNDYFAECLFASMANENYENISRRIQIIVGRSEIDLGDIKQVFKHRYGNTLEEQIEECTTDSSLKTLLITLLTI